MPGGLRVLSVQDGERDPLLSGAALVIFTSGSTGIPKGVVLGHTGILAKLAMVQEALAYQPGDQALAVLRTSFLFCQWDILLTLGTGGSVRLLDKFTPQRTLRSAGGRTGLARRGGPHHAQADPAATGKTNPYATRWCGHARPSRWSWAANCFPRRPATATAHFCPTAGSPSSTG
ncbi:hypothetical protein GCM10020295_37620 [Streptomyces cinereospinus]